MNAIYVLLLLATLYTVTDGQWITEKVVEGVIDRDDDYWVIKSKMNDALVGTGIYFFSLANGRVNRPMFSTYIRFYNSHTAKNEYQIDCFSSPLILYLPTEIVFRSTGHFWSEGDSYFVTLDEGVLFSDIAQNSTSYTDPKFWRFSVVRPRDT